MSPDDASCALVSIAGCWLLSSLKRIDDNRFLNRFANLCITVATFASPVISNSGSVLQGLGFLFLRLFVGRKIVGFGIMIGWEGTPDGRDIFNGALLDIGGSIVLCSSKNTAPSLD